jgi:hypothetical protein
MDKKPAAKTVHEDAYEHGDDDLQQDDDEDHDDGKPEDCGPKDKKVSARILHKKVPAQILHPSEHGKDDNHSDSSDDTDATDFTVRRKLPPGVKQEENLPDKSKIVIWLKDQGPMPRMQEMVQGSVACMPRMQETVQGSVAPMPRMQVPRMQVPRRQETVQESVARMPGMQEKLPESVVGRMIQVPRMQKRVMKVPRMQEKVQESVSRRAMQEMLPDSVPRKLTNPVPDTTKSAFEQGCKCRGCKRQWKRL